MNYYAHGYRFLDDPYFLAGTALPDWMNVVDRRIRPRRRLAEPLVDDADPQMAALARGVVQHHHDDAWFHETRAFAELSLALTKIARDALSADDGFRPSFLGHILVEILLDAELIADDQARLEAYYAAVDQLDPATVRRLVERLTSRRVERLAELLPRFSQERFLLDYLTDAKLAVRLNQVMRRVGLPVLPQTFLAVLPEMRCQVRTRREELLTGPRGSVG